MTHTSYPLVFMSQISGKSVLTTCLLLLLFFPASGHSRPTDADLIKEMARHLVCFTIEQVRIEEPDITIDNKELCLASIYSNTGPQPLWVTVDGPTTKAAVILDHLRNSYRHGLDPADYKVAQLLELWPTEDVTELALLDTTLTYSLVKYVHDISYGQLKPHESDPELFAEAGDADFNPLLTIQHILATQDLNRYLENLPPQHIHYRNLKTALDYYRQIAATEDWPHLADGKSLRPGERDPRVITVRQRLQHNRELPGNLIGTKTEADPDVYDHDLEQVVKEFQMLHGLTPDGVIGTKTRTAMNITAVEKIEIIRVNMARWRWHAHDLGAKHVLVNIASFNLKAYQNGSDEPSLDIPVIVGKEQHQTPVFSDAIAYLDFNPFWNVTTSIAENEELPALRKDPHHLVNRNVRLFSSWRNDAVELDSTTIDWNSVSKSTMRGYKLRQDPGPWNALGKVKFVFPNRYSVYMHDTASPNLFKRTERDFSHGCIRVSDPLALAIFVLDGQEGNWDKEKVTELYKKDSRKVIRLSQSIPVHITYQTTWVDKKGMINFNRDIYARDQKLFSALLQ